jgi:hypothetical protein
VQASRLHYGTYNRYHRFHCAALSDCDHPQSRADRLSSGCENGEPGQSPFSDQRREDEINFRQLGTVEIARDKGTTDRPIARPFLSPRPLGRS